MNTIRASSKRTKGTTTKWDRIAEGIFLLIVVGGVMLFELTEKTARGGQGNLNAQPLGEIILSLLASLFFAAILVRLPGIEVAKLPYTAK